MVVFDTQCAFILFGFGCMLSAKTITHVIELAVYAVLTKSLSEKIAFVSCKPRIRISCQKILLSAVNLHWANKAVVFSP